jgi:ureidoglycolate hydrolase
MDTMLDILDYKGEGYKPLVDFGEWRVAILRYLDALQPDRINSMERHTATDEVFVLLRGTGVLILGGCQAFVKEIYPQVMEIGIIYNVKCNIWHTILLSHDSSVLLVENRDTTTDNTEYTNLTPEQSFLIKEQAQRSKIIET